MKRIASYVGYRRSECSHLARKKAPRRIRTRGCSWYHLISQLVLPLYAALSSDSSVTGLPGDLYSRAGFKISAPKLLPHLRLRTGLAALNRSLCRSVETYSSSSMPLCYEYVHTLPQAAGFVKQFLFPIPRISPEDCCLLPYDRSNPSLLRRLVLSCRTVVRCFRCIFRGILGLQKSHVVVGHPRHPGNLVIFRRCAQCDHLAVILVHI